MRAAAGLGLFLIITFAGSAEADDVKFDFAAGMGERVIDDPSPSTAKAIAIDTDGNVYTTGSFEGTVDFNPGAGSFLLTSASKTDIFVTKLNSDGTFAWARAMSTIDRGEGTGIALDASGANVYITGNFSGEINFHPGIGGIQDIIISKGGTFDIFVTKLDSSGAFVWGGAMGGLEADGGQGIALDASGVNVYITGFFRATADFDPDPDASDITTDLTSAGETDIFVTKLNSDGTLVWAGSMGGTGADRGRGIAVEVTEMLESVYITGFFQGTATDFDPDPMVADPITDLDSVGLTDVFVQKLDTDGVFVWARSMGGTGADKGFSIAVDGAGNTYTTGTFEETADFDPGAEATDLTSAGQTDIFVSKLDSSGNFVLAGAMGGTGADTGNSIALDGSGNMYTTGTFEEKADFDPGARIVNRISQGNTDIYISKLDSTGKFVWVKAMGGTDLDRGLGIAVDAGDTYTTGDFEGTVDFDPGAGIHNKVSEGLSDIFLSKLISYEPVWVDFGFVGSEDGAFDTPFDTLAEGLAVAPFSTAVRIKGDTGDSVSNETMIINQVVTIEAIKGTVSIGDPGGRGSENERRGGFVSRD